MRDTRTIYEQCMEPGQPHEVIARDVSMALESPFALRCEYHVDTSKKDPDDSFNKLLRERGIAHEEKMIDTNYPRAIPIKYDTQEEGFAEALKIMAANAAVLDNPPLFYRPEGMHGRPDVLVKCDGRSAFGGHHYRVVEIKLIKTPKKKHILQAAFYNKLVGFVQQYTPEQFFIIGGDGMMHEYDYGDYADSLDEMIILVRRIRDGYVPPPVYGQDTSWSAYSNEKAVEARSVTLIPDIGMKMAHDLNEAGFKTIHDVAASNEAEITSVNRIKMKAAKFIASAHAITSGKAVRLQADVRLPEHSTEIFIDLEGLGLLNEESIHDYLIGLWIRDSKGGRYKSFIADGKREDIMLKEFVKFMDEQSDYVLYHWHNYEYTYLRKMMDRHGIDAYHLLEKNVLVDLLPICKKAFALPTHSHSLKDVAKWLGYEWKHTDVGAMTSIILYLDYVNDPTRNWKSMQKVLDYNRDDCEATRIVKDWMVSNS